MSQSWDAQLPSFGSYRLVRKLFARPDFTSYFAREFDGDSRQDLVIHICDQRLWT
jgi:hypothetical protein